MDNDAVVYTDGYWGEHEHRVNAFYCSKLDKYLIPPKAEHKGNAYEFGDIENVPMPKECEHQNKVKELEEVGFGGL